MLWGCWLRTACPGACVGPLLLLLLRLLGWILSVFRLSRPFPLLPLSLPPPPSPSPLSPPSSPPPRYTSALCALDRDTVALADRFGSLAVLRVPAAGTAAAAAVADAEAALGHPAAPGAGAGYGAGYGAGGAGGAGAAAAAARALWEASASSAHGAANPSTGNPSGAACPKLDLAAHYYLGETVTSLRRAALLPGAPEVLLAATVTGALHAFLPLASKEDVSFFTGLETSLRQELAPGGGGAAGAGAGAGGGGLAGGSLCQRDHLSFRSFYQPVRHVVDGELCERFGALGAARQAEVARSLGRSPAEVIKKLEETRHFV